ncbi:site-specific DNA-methyltransferase [Thiocystis minor]|uniref:site-specific DNA-methyltransferase n=1 Tax=Thiocystis minor TaxID=61597 RepID=UPI00191393DF|nr:site-specific DNA-methyltransferase [Thiocystis minor]MBK5964038.1 site-specific DNA-methyltransferase [Thiocystis minor]
MPELDFKGKEFVYNHHLAIPHRPLIPQPGKSIGEPRLDGNLIVHGDNLHALKALLPMYAGRVDCIFIDPPYNTGNEGWSYNDNVNSPMLREWLDSNPVGIEDGLRHDKWLCMMWPRLRLLHELLSESGSFWMTLDDNEIHRARMMLDEIFGADNFVATCIWHKNYSPKPSAQFFSEDHDYLLIYAKDKTIWRPNLLERTDDMDARYDNPDNDTRGPWKPGDLSARNYYGEGTYPITCPSGRIIPGPPSGRYWVISEAKFKEMDHDDRVWWGEDGNNIPSIKRFLSEVKAGRVPQTLWEYDEVGHTQDAKKELLSVLDFASSDDVFVTPKPVALLSRVLELATTEHSIVLDSFAGSATTAHAVLTANHKDGGDRTFILVEGEDYADTLTAERARRVIDGYAFSGNQREELHRERLTFTSLKKADTLLDHVESIKTLEGHRFDRIKSEVKDGELIVTGEKAITERVAGLGGGFAFCTLGEAVDMDRMLTGESLPAFEQLGALLFHTATNEIAPNPFPTEEVAGCGYLGASTHYHVWLIYRPDLEFLKSREAALTLSRADAMVDAKPDKPHRVFAPAKFVSQKLLNDSGLPVEFAPLPFALYRIA